MGQIDISITRGDTRTYEFDLVDEDGDPADLVGGSLVFTARESVYSDEPVMELEPTIGGPAGQALLQIPASETLDLANEWHTLVCDLRFINGASNVTTPMTGVLRVAPSFGVDESS